LHYAVQAVLNGFALCCTGCFKWLCTMLYRLF